MVTCTTQIVVLVILLISIVTVILFQTSTSTPTTIPKHHPLEIIRTRIQLLLRHLARVYPEEQKVQRLIHRSRYTRIHPSVTSETFTMNKGESIHICLQKGDLNTFMFVILHEMAHVMSLSIHHTPEFWLNFKFLLQEAAKIHIYTPVDYTHTPVPYCTMKITGNPYFKTMSEQEWIDQIRRVLYSEIGSS